MVYFKTCSSIDEAKAMHKMLAKQFHPDFGGDTATMQAINIECAYAYACAKVIKDDNLIAPETGGGMRLFEEYRAVIEALMSIPGILIEVVGQ